MNLVFKVAVIFLVCSCTHRKNGSTSLESSSSNKVPARKAAPKEAGQKLHGKWYGTWEQADHFSKSTLTITRQTDDSLSFSLFASSGANTGEIDGVAVGSLNVASFRNAAEGDTCIISFQLLGDSAIIVDQQQGMCGTGLGVDYSGPYLNTERKRQAPMTAVTLVTLGILQNDQEDEQFRKLVGEDYALFLNSSQLTSESTDMDSLQARVRKSGVRGLFTYQENIILINDRMEIWAAVIEEEKVYYYTNSHQFKASLPRTVEQWRDRFADKEVIFKE